MAVRGLVEEKPWIESDKYGGTYFVDELIGPDCRDSRGELFTARIGLFTWDDENGQRVTNPILREQGILTKP